MKKRSSTSRGKRKSLGLSFFLVALPVSLLIALILFVGLVFLVLRSNYLSWETEFENSHLSVDYLNVQKSTNKEVEKKIESFKASTKEVDFVEINHVHFVNLLATKINENLPSRLSIKKMYVEPAQGFWKIYYKVNVKGFGDFWLYFDLNKDQVESTDLYITDFKVGNLSVKDWGGENIVVNINEGIKEAMILITQKDFTGRTIRNIELDEENIVIKGEK
ncbi:hypothetical protein HYV12_04305 [Candidatus Dojkabacteria bacterium]|nr:hypothetical protein [Candidatus Dojkabacteria bacterium]